MPSAWPPSPIAFSFYFCLAGRFFKFGMSDGTSGGLLQRRSDGIQNAIHCLGHYTIFVLRLWCNVGRSTPSAPPRAFPLWLLAPRCLGIRTAQIPGNEPFGFFLGRGSFLSPGRDYTLGLPRVFCPRHPHSRSFNISFSEYDFRLRF